ncbi:MAG: DUF2752 domain-containing protein [Acidobacteria bacterium]|nr:DUF2752 domain-containing protein [Acidobacteriota bacterium]
MNSSIQEMSEIRDFASPARFHPILAVALAKRPTGLALFVLGTLNMLTGLFGISILPCPLMNLTGFPCPGCGLTRACELLLRFEWQQALHMHAFVLFIIPGLIVIFLATVPRERFRRRFLTWLAAVESRTGVVAVILVALVIYWLLRLVVMPENMLKIVENNPLLTF